MIESPGPGMSSASSCLCDGETILPGDHEISADQLLRNGNFDTGREKLLLILHAGIHPLASARIYRKLAMSHILQQTWLQAPAYLSKANEILEGINSKTDEWYFELIELHIVRTEIIYFNNCWGEEYHRQNEKLKKIIEERGSPQQQMRQHRQVLLNSYARYRWTAFPDEIVSHAKFYMTLARAVNEMDHIIDSTAGLAFVQFGRNEIEKSIETYALCLQLLDGRKSYHYLIAHAYTALGYRMLNRVTECERWTGLLENAAIETGHEVYHAYALSNRAWLAIKRKNILYAREFATRSFEVLQRYNHPFIWLACVPLIRVFCDTGDWSSAGIYAHSLVNPWSKKFPVAMETAIDQAVRKWQQADWEQIAEVFENLVSQAGLCRYE